jgi:hypothetical protein
MKFILRTARPKSMSTLGINMFETSKCVTHSHNSTRNAFEARLTKHMATSIIKTIEEYVEQKINSYFPRIEIPKKYPLVKISPK